MGNLVVMLALIAVLCFTLTIAGLIVEYIFPHCKWINRYIDNLPMMTN